MITKYQKLLINSKILKFVKTNIVFCNNVGFFFSLLITLILICIINTTYQWNLKTTIIIVTPTYNRQERIADLTRLSQTLMHISDVHWIVIEDSNQTYNTVKRILERSKLTHIYFYTIKKTGFPSRGWTQRNMALKYIKKNYRDYDKNAVVYFADDDNSYDIRLFDKYIKKVQKIGVWAVGLVGGALVEAPHVINGIIKKWDVIYKPQRKFATDMAGFAINLNLILHSNASFNSNCIGNDPETCFLTQFNISIKDIEAYGFYDNPKDILVWHTKTTNLKVHGKNYGYVTE